MDKAKKQELLDAITLIGDAFDQEIQLEIDNADKAKSTEGKAFHVERQLEYGCGKSGLLKLRAKLLSNHG